MRIITGKARGLQLTVPKTYDVRPTADRVKESVFNIIGSKIIGAEVLDLLRGQVIWGWKAGAVVLQLLHLLTQARNRCAWCEVILPSAVRSLIAECCREVLRQWLKGWRQQGSCLTLLFATLRTIKAGLSR